MTPRDTKANASVLSRRDFLARSAMTGVSFTALGAFLSGCGSGQAPPGSGGSLTVVINESPWLPAFETVAEAFRKETGTKVNIRAFPFDTVLSQMRNAVNAKTDTFDLFTISEVYAAEFYEGGFLTPLQDIDSDFSWPDELIEYDSMARWNDDAGYFDPNGTVYGIPINGNISLLAYRSDLYEQMGLAPPTTWEDVFGAAKQASTEFKDIHGYSAIATWFFALNVILGYGGSVFADPPNDWTVTLDSEEALAGLETYLRLTSYGPPQPQSISQPEWLGAMQAGRLLQGHTVAAVYSPLDDKSKSKVPFKVDWSVVPKPASGEHASISGGFVQAIPKHISKKQKKSAYEFLTWIAQKDAQMKYARAGSIVTRQDVYTSSLADKKEFRYMTAMADSSPYIHGFARYTFGAELRTQLGVRVEEALSGKTNTKQTLLNMTEDVKKLAAKAGVA